MIKKINYDENTNLYLKDWRDHVKLRNDVMYYTEVEYVNFCPQMNMLQVIYKLTCESDEYFDYVLVDYQIGSYEYNRLLELVYGPSTFQIIMLDVDNFYQLICYSKIYFVKHGNVRIDLESVKHFQTCWVFDFCEGEEYEKSLMKKRS